MTDEQGRQIGCTGGSPFRVFSYLQTHAAVLAKWYPYTGVAGTCRSEYGGDLYTASMSGHAVKGWGVEVPSFLTPREKMAKLSEDILAGLTYSPCLTASCGATQSQWEMNLVRSVKLDGPFVAYVDASSWGRYGNGIFDPSHCSSDPTKANQLVQLIGLGTEQDGTNAGVPFWIVKTNYGPEWGEKGENTNTKRRNEETKPTSCTDCTHHTPLFCSFSHPFLL